MKKIHLIILASLLFISCRKEKDIDTIGNVFLHSGENKDIIISTKILDTLYQSGGKITIIKGNYNIIQRGVCCSKNILPSLKNYHTIDGSGSGSFVSEPKDIEFGSSYYLRAYAITEDDTIYGNSIFCNVKPLEIGKQFGGGIVFYIDGTGQHGLICASSDQTINSISFGCTGTQSGATATDLYTGVNNTQLIIAQCPYSNSPAQICHDLELNSYNDWYLPSRDELALMFSNLFAKEKNKLGNFTYDSFYWSSSEIGFYVYSQHFQYSVFGSNTLVGQMKKIPKSEQALVRAIRSF